jgi:hypothetical protein
MVGMKKKSSFLVEGGVQSPDPLEIHSPEEW